MVQSNKPELQNSLPCRECVYMERDLIQEPCWSCFICPDKHGWKKDETRDNESEQMGRENCSSCKVYL